MKIKIYRVVAQDGPYVSTWHTSRKACNALIRSIKQERFWFLGDDLKIEWTELIIDK